MEVSKGLIAAGKKVAVLFGPFVELRERDGWCAAVIRNLG